MLRIWLCHGSAMASLTTSHGVGSAESIFEVKTTGEFHVGIHREVIVFSG